MRRAHARHCLGCSYQFAWQFESLLPVLLSTASGTLAWIRLLLGMAVPCFGMAKLMGNSSDTLVTAISTARTQSISASTCLGWLGGWAVMVSHATRYVPGSDWH